MIEKVEAIESYTDVEIGDTGVTAEQYLAMTEPERTAFRDALDETVEQGRGGLADSGLIDELIEDGWL